MELLRLNDLAYHFDVSHTTIRNWIKDLGFPEGSRARWKRDEVLLWARRNNKPTRHLEPREA